MGQSTGATARQQQDFSRLVNPRAVAVVGASNDLSRIGGQPLKLLTEFGTEDRLYQYRKRFGHTIAADSFLLLEEAVATGAVRPGMRVLLFTYGFGSSWCALLLEATGEVAR